jgi:hypothetical protein
MRIVAAISLYIALSAMTGCGSSPAGPSQVGKSSVTLAVFTDPVFTVTTSDVRDVQEQIVQFDTTSGSLIWKATNQSFPGYSVSGNLINGTFQVQFGIKDGERRAYFTDAATGTVCDIEVVNSRLVISPTGVPVPSAPLQLAVFGDSQSGLMTSDIRDVQGHVVQFDTSNRVLIWKATGQTFPGYLVNGNLINSTFQVRFGTDGGERRAYFTEMTTATICDIEIVNGQLVISPTNVPVPGGG